MLASLRLRKHKFACMPLFFQGLATLFCIPTVYPGIQKIIAGLRKQGRVFSARKLGGWVFAIFFDPSLAEEDPYLVRFANANALFWTAFKIRLWMKRRLPRPIVQFLVRLSGAEHLKKSDSGPN